MQRRLLGQGLDVSAQGLGCMGMSEFYGEVTDVTLTAADIDRLEEIVPAGAVIGDRYADMSPIEQ